MIETSTPEQTVAAFAVAGLCLVAIFLFGRWVLAGRGFPEVVMVDLEISTDSGVLVAATHGMGLFWLNLR